MLGSGKSGEDAYADTATRMSDRHAARSNKGLHSAVRDALVRRGLVEGGCYRGITRAPALTRWRDVTQAAVARGVALVVETPDHKRKAGSLARPKSHVRAAYVEL